MRQRTPLLEWHFAEDKQDLQDAPWPPLVPAGSPAAPPRLSRSYLWGRSLWGGSAVLLILFALTGIWLWQRAEAGLDQVETELGSVLQLELASAMPEHTRPPENMSTGAAARIWKAQLKHDQEMLDAVSLHDLAAALPAPTVHLIDLQDDLVAANFVTAAREGKAVYRQTRFYRQTTEGWQRAKPHAELWGSSRQLETAHFIFRFRSNDARVVAAVAPRMDALYTELQRNFGLTSEPNKLMIEVSIEAMTGAIISPRWVYGPLVVPSPALYLVPVELSNSDILAQSIAIPLIDYMARRVMAEHEIPSRWDALKPGLELWQLWKLEMPLARWREPIVTWLYANGTAQRPAQPSTYQALCTMHRLWMLSPVLIGIPLECLHADEGGWAMTRSVAQVPFAHLDALAMPLNEDDYYRTDDPLVFSMRSVATAALIEYAVATYGYEKLPTLLASLAQHDDWGTLLPATYAVSAPTFEEGWLAYLHTHYR